MRHILPIVASVVLCGIGGCGEVSSPGEASHGDVSPVVTSSKPMTEDAAIASLNEQIELYNATRWSGEFPIDQRAARVVYDSSLDRVMCFDGRGEAFLVLERIADGRFKGAMEVEFHELVGSGPDGSHSWGVLYPEFYLPAEAFGPAR